MTDPEPKRREAAGVVAVILACGMAVALNVLTAALLWAAVQRLGVDAESGLNPEGTQVLLGWGGGIISVLAGYVGYIVGRKTKSERGPDDPELPHRPGA